MATNEQIRNVIKSVLALLTDQRLAVMNAIHFSLAGPSSDHGSAGPPEEFLAAWKDEIADRIADIEGGHVKANPADDAESMIHSNARPSV